MPHLLVYSTSFEHDMSHLNRQERNDCISFFIKHTANSGKMEKEERQERNEMRDAEMRKKSRTEREERRDVMFRLWVPGSRI